MCVYLQVTKGETKNVASNNTNRNVKQLTGDIKLPSKRGITDKNLIISSRRAFQFVTEDDAPIHELTSLLPISSKNLSLNFKRGHLLVKSDPS